MNMGKDFYWENAQKIKYLAINVTLLLHKCNKYPEIKLISAYFFTFVNTSVTLVNNYITFNGKFKRDY